MGKVHVLSSDLANQIAAGEVVERPASVVKELVENALDAGATKIVVEIENGGTTRIRVTDDGEGMEEADARLALLRHATSKIASLDDLARIATLGFRGEALPSIGSVAKLTLTTRARGTPEGRALLLAGGGEPAVRPAGCAEGTSVDVADLFFNVPARRKFLKAQATEAAHVGEVVLMASLASPGVTFTLARDGKVAREYLRVATRKERVAQAVVEDRLASCAAERGPLRLEAHLAPPERARSGAGGLYVLVNGRPVRDRQLARAVAQAYGSVLEAGRYPVGVVYVDLPPESVDVNVHPQKAEVRFADARALLDGVTRALHAELTRAFSVPPLGGPRPWFASSRGPGSVLPPAPRAAIDGGESAGVLRARPPITLDGPPPVWDAPSYAIERPAALPVAEDALVVSHERGVLPSGVPNGAANAEPLLGGAPGFYGRLRFVGQMRAMFLLCEGDDALYVLDQHAAAERVTFDRLRRSFGSRAIASQRLLVPEIVELNAREVEALGEREQEVLALGLEIRAAGLTAVAIHAVPKVLARARPERLVRDLAAELGRDAKRPFGDAADLVLATMACHGSIRAGDLVQREEASALLAALDAVDFAGHCPHGRPVVTRLPFDELERRVGR